MLRFFFGDISEVAWHSFASLKKQGQVGVLHAQKRLASIGFRSGPRNYGIRYPSSCESKWFYICLSMSQLRKAVFIGSRQLDWLSGYHVLFHPFYRGHYMTPAQTLYNCSGKAHDKNIDSPVCLIPAKYIATKNKISGIYPKLNKLLSIYLGWKQTYATMIHCTSSGFTLCITVRGSTSSVKWTWPRGEPRDHLFGWTFFPKCVGFCPMFCVVSREELISFVVVWVQDNFIFFSRQRSFAFFWILLLNQTWLDFQFMIRRTPYWKKNAPSETVPCDFHQ